MKAKNLTLMIASVLSIFLFASLVSADINFANVVNDDVTVNQGDSVTLQFRLHESNLGDLTDIVFGLPVTMTSGSHSFNSSSTITNVITELGQNETSVLMSLTFNVPLTQNVGTYTGELTVDGNYSGNSTSETLPISIVVEESVEDWESDFCLWEDGDNDNPGELDVKIDDIKVTGFGDDESWFSFDEVEITVVVDNKGDDDVDNIELEWGLYDEETDEWVIDVDDEKDFDLKDGKDEEIVFTITIDDSMDIDLEDLSDGKHYVLYVRAHGEVDTSGSPNTCDSDSEQIEIVIENDFVIATEFKLSYETV